jgi:signal transduction histidine kinase
MPHRGSAGTGAEAPRAFPSDRHILNYSIAFSKTNHPHLPRRDHQMREGHIIKPIDPSALPAKPLFLIGADGLQSRKSALLEKWREMVRADPRLPDCRLRLDDEQLEDHLPALLDSIETHLRERGSPDQSVCAAGAQHGSTRRTHGYSIAQLIWEFAIFRRLLRETVEELGGDGSAAETFELREAVLKIVDLSELASVKQYVEESRVERDHAREQLRKANEQKDRFLAVLSHELRNPLASISMAAQILQSERSSQAERDRALEIVLRQATYQTRLIDDLLDMNRISQGRMELRRERMDLRRAAKNVIATYMPAIESKSISFRLDAPGYEVAVFADPVRVEQIISNLLANSLKFTRARGSIEIVLERQGGTAAITVRDTGAGIDPSKLAEIFELFSQADAGKAENGLGIGLWLAKQLVEMHGGIIEAKSEGSDRGTEFVVRLASDGPSETNTPLKRMLLVEDDPDQRELLSLALRGFDGELLAAKDGAEAIAVASRYAFDICILDLNLPDMSGFDLVSRLIELHNGRLPLMIALTGYGRPEEIAKVKAAGFQHHLVKPAKMEELQRLVGLTE